MSTVSSGSARSVDREELKYPSAEHYTWQANQKQGERHCHSSSEDNLKPEWNTNCDIVREDREELLFPAAGHAKRQAERYQAESIKREGERYCHSPSEDNLKPEWNTNCDIVREDREELFPAAGHDKRQAERHHAESIQSEGERYSHSPSEYNLLPEWNANCNIVREDREELLFPSAGHDKRDADPNQGDRYCHSPSEDNLRPKWNAN